MKTKDWTESKVEIYDRGYATGYQHAFNELHVSTLALTEALQAAGGKVSYAQVEEALASTRKERD